MNILFADSQGVVRHGTITIARTIAPSMKVFEASSHHQVCQHLRNEDITMLFLNTDMFEEHSSTSISKFKSISPNLKILLLSTYAEKIFGYHLMQAGADGFISSSYNLLQMPCPYFWNTASTYQLTYNRIRNVKRRLQPLIKKVSHKSFLVERRWYWSI